MEKANPSSAKKKAKKSETKNTTLAQVASLLQQIGLNMLMVGLVALLAYLVWQRFFAPQTPALTAEAAEPLRAAGGAESRLAEIDPNLIAALDPLTLPPEGADSVARRTNIKTIIPSRPRTTVITYTVQRGDSLFLIAQNFGLKPSTILFGNYEALQDNPHLLKPQQVLNILPVDGAYYQWQEGDNLLEVAARFHVEPQVILEYPGNGLDLTTTDITGKGIEPGTWLIIPGGKRPIKDWGPPAITRSNPAVARYYGKGFCGSVYEGAIGTGTFIWPTTDRTISGYTYDPDAHPAVDIGGAEGNPIYATDSGVVVYAGWSDYGYGYLIVIDHGNGWQSAYAHLSAVAVTCGQSVYQGGYIGAMGSTGNSSGPHLHFELAINGVKVNPLDYIGY